MVNPALNRPKRRHSPCCFGAVSINVYDFNVPSAHMNTQKLTDTVNQSGFPLQIGLTALIQSTTSQHGWKVLFNEHSWRNELNNDSGFIDIVIEHKHGTLVMLIECKRVIDSSWIFLVPKPKATPRRQAKAWVTRYVQTCFKHLWWRDLSLDPISPESDFCVIPGQDSRSKPMLERVAADVVSATEALALEEKDYQAQSKDTLRIYFSVIVTTAKLQVCSFEPEQVSLVDGKVADAKFSEVPFVRFRKQLSTRPASVPLNVVDGFYGFVRAKEHTVFVVNAEALPDFLAQFEVDNNALRPLV